ncbi:hypothetical protein RSO01_65640 [Reyranella soli]|uniref:Uncharacterized protein n=1 Tax=Reyranella soli TaxID=1230389 RepID=A0A512NKC2_9HYPH|nr:hypothetical protein RSO01_65640 [Reyranella soli]
MEARALVELDQSQPLVELPTEIGAGAVHMVEDAELHAFPHFGRCYKVCLKKYPGSAAAFHVTKREDHDE